MRPPRRGFHPVGFHSLRGPWRLGDIHHDLETAPPGHILPFHLRWRLFPVASKLGDTGQLLTALYRGGRKAPRGQKVVETTVYYAAKLSSIQDQKVPFVPHPLCIRFPLLHEYNCVVLVFSLPVHHTRSSRLFDAFMKSFYDRRDRPRKGYSFYMRPIKLSMCNCLCHVWHLCKQNEI